MKKIALLLLVSALTIATLASCGSDSQGTTTAAKGSSTPVNSSATTSSSKPETTTGSKPATTAGTPATTTAGTPATTTAGTPATTTAGTTTTGNEQPDTPVKSAITGWVDNNEEDGNVYYQITANSDGTVKVDYTKEDHDYAANRYGYAGFSWVNMKADISGVYTNQSKLVLKIKGESGKSLLIKPFDDQAFEKTLNFDGTEQELTIELKNVKADANKVIIMFGDGGATDSTGTFTILEAYFAD